MLDIITAALVSGLVLVYIYLRWNFNYWKKQCVCGPKPVILHGTFPKSSRGECDFSEELSEIYQKYKSSEKFVGIFVARDPRLFILDPEIARQILTTNFSNFHDNESSKWSFPKIELLRCQSPFVNVGEAWKEKRSEIVPALTMNRMRSSYPAMQVTAKKLSSFIALNSGELDAKELAGRFTSEAISNYIWSINADAFKEEKLCKIHEVASDMLSQSLKCVGYYVKTAAWPWIRKLKPKRFFPESSDAFFCNLTKDVMDQRSRNPNDYTDVLGHLLSLCNKKPLSDSQVAGHSLTVLIDGYETAAIAISHCLMLLGRNKSAQKKLRNEILEIYNEEEGISYDQLNDLQYLDQCIHETLRIFPPLSTLMKICTATTTLENFDGRKVVLKPGDCAYISSYVFHRDSDIFENPEEFIPERFDTDLGGIRKYRDLGVFLPFGDGPRMCLGMKLGLLETKAAVAEIVRNFDIGLGQTTRSDNKIGRGFLLSIAGGIKLKFKPIK